MMRRLLSLFLLCLILTSCTKPAAPRLVPEQTRANSQSAEAPLRMFHHLPLVEVMVNDQGPYWFMLDTGAGIVVVSDRLADRLSLPGREAKGRITGAAGEKKQVRNLFHVESIDLGNHRFRHVDAVSLDLAMARDVLGTDLDGILSFGLFAEVLLTLDFSQNKMILQQGSLPAADGKDILAFERFEGAPTIPIRIDERETTTIIDTGNGSIMSVPKDIFDTISFSHGPVEGKSIMTVGGTRREITGRLDGTVLIGSHQAVDPIVDVGVGSLGIKLLKHFVITFDQANSRVKFSRTDQSAPIRFPSDRSAGISLIKKDNDWTVYDIIPNTPASRLDIKVGDQVVSINDITADQFDLDRWTKLVDSTNVLFLRLQRNNQAFTVIVPVIDLVP